MTTLSSTEEQRPAPIRAVMFLNDNPFERDWYEAARRMTETICVEKVDRLQWPRVAGSPYVARNPSRPHEYQIETVNWRPSRVLGRVGDLFMRRRYQKALEAIAQDHGSIDLLHGHFYAGSQFLPALSRATGLPYVITEHSSALTGGDPQKVITTAGRKRAARIYRSAAAVAAVSEELAASLRDLRLTDGPIQVIGNPVDTEGFRPAERLPSEAIRVVTVGSLVPAKGHEALLRAFALARASEPRLTLSVVGEGTSRRSLEDLARSLDLNGSVTFTGWLSRPALVRLLQNSDVYAQASRVETFGIAPLEALSCGLPVVLTDVGQAPSVLPEGAGIVVEPGDLPGFASALLDVAQRVETTDRRSLSRLVREGFSFESVGSRLEALYRAIRAEDQGTATLRGLP